MGTVSDGSAIEISYEGHLTADDAAETLVRVLNEMDGVESVQLQRRKTKGD